ncbi:MAG TPA: alpha/beta hydrolase [Acidimicrobiales bacterium]
MAGSGGGGETTTVAVDGGDLLVGAWGPKDAPVVVAAHGITGNHLHFAFVARALASDHRVLAPDLRGRGNSAAVGGPYGMAAHARDLLAVLDDAGADRAVLVGHSMGAFVAVAMAAAYPDRVARAVLVDGGLPLGTEVVAGEDIDATLDRVIGPAVQRLAMTFASHGAYHEFWKAHPAIGGDWTDELRAAVDYDLMGEPPKLRSGVSADAVRGDGADNVDDGRVLPAADRSACSLRLLWAERGMLGQSPGLYTAATVARFRARFGARFDDERVHGVNHYTIALSERGAVRIAAAVRDDRA